MAKGRIARQGLEEIIVDPKVIAMFISWDLVVTGAGYKVEEVQDAIKEIGLPEEARDIRSRSAIIRAIKAAATKLKTVEVLNDDKDKMMFQITRIEKEDHTKYGKIAKYILDNVITFDKQSCDISCENPRVKTFVEEKFLYAKDYYRTTDITRILLRMFKKHAEIVSLRKAGGSYMVPGQFREYVEKIAQFIRRLSPKNKVSKYSIQRTKDGSNEAEVFALTVNAKIREFARLREKAMQIADTAKEVLKKTGSDPTKSENMAKNMRGELKEISRSSEMWVKSIDFALDDYKGPERDELMSLKAKLEKMQKRARVRLKKTFKVAAVAKETKK